jgi:hypothetical protein
MNEVLAPIYYLFKLDPTSDFQDEAEADSFWCRSFVNPSKVHWGTQ